MLAPMTVFEDHVARIRAGEPIDSVARSLLAQLTPDERLWCLDGDLEFWPGLAAMMAGEYNRLPYPGAAIPRLGVPGIQFSDGPRGAAIGRSTCFPVSMARGATFDPGLEERVGDAIGQEVLAQGANLFGGVCVNLLRHPAWGRAQETYGEDPLHVGAMGAALTRGVRRHVMACAKHFALNSIENARFKVDVSADDRTLHEVYLPHFKDAVDAGAEVVMSAYNSVNGAYCGENRPLLTGVLREEWGFDGIVISDWIVGLRDAVASVKAGLDIEMPFRQQRAAALPSALADGRLSWGDVDDAVLRVLSAQLRYAARRADPPPLAVVASEAHRALAREVAEKAIVLLKNDPVAGRPVLPLDRGALRWVAVIGRLADRANLGDRGSSNVRPPTVVTPLEGLRAALGGVEIAFDDGSDVTAAAAAAAKTDVALVIVGLTAEDEGEYIQVGGDPALTALFPPPSGQVAATTAERSAVAAGGLDVPIGGDRASLDLRPGDVALVDAVAAANPRTVVILMGGSAITMEEWRARVPSILYLWYPGMEGGHALARVLLGEVNPSGRLPFAIPADPSHLPFFDRDASTATYDGGHGQWKLDRDGHAAAFPYGFGLSYTSFAVSSLDCRADGESVTCDVEVANTGSRPGATVVQVYAGLPGSRFERPRRKLAGFARVELAPGESRTVQVVVPWRRLAVRDRGRWTVEPGRYEFVAGQFAGDDASVAALVHN